MAADSPCSRGPRPGLCITIPPHPPQPILGAPSTPHLNDTTPTPSTPPPQVLVTPVGRLKVCGLGVSEALASEVVPSGADELLQLQRDDVVVSGCVGALMSPTGNVVWELSGPLVGAACPALGLFDCLLLPFLVVLVHAC